MKFIVLVHGEAVSGMQFSLDAPNPGIGGTQFTRIRLADAFARRFPANQVEVVSEHQFEIVNAPDNLTQQVSAFDDYLAALAATAGDWVVTGPSMLLKRISPDILRRIASRTIITSHLMHDADLWDAERMATFGAAGCVGAYHFHATRPKSPKVYVRNLFMPGWAPPSNGRTRSHDDAARLKIVHIGPLLPLKGFDDRAAIWPEIKAAVPEVQLDGIGGANVYGTSNSHGLLPTTKAFGDKILESLELEDVSSGRVKFWGRLGVEKTAIIKSANVAVLNAASRPECFPGTLLECMDLGTPVVGSAANGLWDSMRHFPELTSKTPSEIPTILARLATNHEELLALSRRSQNVAADFRLENDQILDRWNAVATALLNDKNPVLAPPTPRPMPQHKALAVYAKKRMCHELRRSKLGEVLAFIKGKLRGL